MFVKHHPSGYTLIEMVVALAVGSIAVAGAYASYELVSKQVQKIEDLSGVHQSGRTIMSMIERDVRMAGFEWREESSGNPEYGTISDPIAIKDSGSTDCCDEITLVYDHRDESSNTTERVSIHYGIKPYTGSKGTRGRLYRKKDVLMPVVKPGVEAVVADYVEDIQFSDPDNPQGADPGLVTSSCDSPLGRRYQLPYYMRGFCRKLDKAGKPLSDNATEWACVKDEHTGLTWEVKTLAHESELHSARKSYRWGGIGEQQPGWSKDHSRPYGVRWDAGYKDQQFYFPGGASYHDWDTLVNGTNSENLCGSNNWRVPTLIEMQSIGNNYVNRPNPLERWFGRSHYWSPAWGSFWTSDFFLTQKNHGITGGSPFPSGSSASAIRMTDPLMDVARFSNRDYKFMVRLVSSEAKKATQLVSISLILRTRKEYGAPVPYKSKDSLGGNHRMDKTDGYKRDEFSTTVLARNVGL